MLPNKYKWLLDEPGPLILKNALALYGTKELKGEANSPVILGWADEIGGWIGRWYEQDSIPWCGLFVGICAKRAGFPFSQKLLSAAEWKFWGQPSLNPMLGDVCIFKRDGGGHVGFYVGEDDEAYHILGGNQSDAVTITRIAKGRLVASRRCKWRVSEPQNVRRVFLSPEGALSRNEA